MTTAVNEARPEVHDFHTRIDSDAAFKTGINQDPVTTLRSAGMDELAEAVERESDRLRRLADRYREDPAFHSAVDSDPLNALQAEGIPPVVADAFLRGAGAPAQVINRASGDVEAHICQWQILTWSLLVVALGVVLFAGEAIFFSDAASAPGCRFC